MRFVETWVGETLSTGNSGDENYFLSKYLHLLKIISIYTSWSLLPNIKERRFIAPTICFKNSMCRFSLSFQS